MDNKKLKENKDVPSLDGEQDNEDSTSTPEAVIDDGSTREQEEENEHSSTTKDNEQDNEDSSSTPNQSSWDDDDNESGDDEEYEAVSSDDESEAVRSAEDGNENEEQAEKEDEFGVQQVEEGCSGGMKKRRRFTLQEKLMYLQVVFGKSIKVYLYEKHRNQLTFPTSKFSIGRSNQRR